MRMLAWISWRAARLEILLVLVAGIVLGVVAAATAAQLRPLLPATDACVAQLRDLVDTDACPEGLTFLRTRIGMAGSLIGLLAYVPWVFGGLLGAAVVARELERGTVVLPWWLSGGRGRWLAGRAVLPLGVLVLSIGVAAVGEGLLAAARFPWLDPWASFYDFGLWGPTPVLAAVAAFTVGLAVGAIVGRQVLAFVLTLLVCAVLLNVVSLAAPYGIGLTVKPGISGSWDGTGFQDGRFQAPDGTLVTWEQAAARAPADVVAGGHADAWVNAHYRQVTAGVPGSRLPEVLARQSIVLAAVALAAGMLAWWVVRRRRPLR